tara:strand:+ start:919 stop:1944 length:1026 start_codon:yes stop_codon:yes gene_type:complete
MRILYILSQYRVCERILPTIPVMSNKYSLDCLLIYQMSDHHRWPGNKDLRSSFHDDYSSFFNKISTTNTDFDFTDYDMIICDDNRNTPKTKLNQIYNQKKGVMIGCYHGAGEKWNNINFFREGYKTVWDKTFVMGKKDVKFDYCLPIGIPSNDSIKNYKRQEKHILVIVNFLANRHSPFKINFDGKLFDNLDLPYLQNKHKLPIVIKLKSRDDESNTQQKNIDYLRDILPSVDYKIIVDYKDNNELISNSKIVFTAPSTLAYKPIQLCIPTIIIKDSGQLGNFGDYKGLVSNDKIKISNKLDELQNEPADINFIEQNVAGGVNFSSTSIMINQMERLLYDK